MAFIARDCDVVKVISPCEAASVMQELFDNGTDKTQAAAKAADLLKKYVLWYGISGQYRYAAVSFWKERRRVKKAGIL